LNPLSEDESFFGATLLKKLEMDTINKLEVLFNDPNKMNSSGNRKLMWNEIRMKKYKLFFELNRLRTVIGDQLSLRHYLKNSLELKLKPIRLNRLMKNYLEIFSYQCQVKEMDLHLEYDHKLATNHFYTEPSMLIHSIENLVHYILLRVSMEKLKFIIKCNSREGCLDIIPVVFELQIDFKDSGSYEIIRNLLLENLIQPMYLEKEITRIFAEDYEKINPTEIGFLLSQIYLNKLGAEVSVPEDPNHLVINLTFKMKSKKEDFMNMEEAESTSEDEDDEEIEEDPLKQLDNNESETSYLWPKNYLVSVKRLDFYTTSKKAILRTSFDPFQEALNSESSDNSLEGGRKSEVSLVSSLKSIMPAETKTDPELQRIAEQHINLTPNNDIRRPSVLTERDTPIFRQSKSDLNLNYFANYRFDSSNSIIRLNQRKNNLEVNPSVMSFNFNNKQQKSFKKGNLRLKVHSNSDKNAIDLPFLEDNLKKSLFEQLKAHPNHIIDDYAVNSNLDWVDFFKIGNDNNYDSENLESQGLTMIEKMVKKNMSHIESGFVKTLYIFTKQIRAWREKNQEGKFVFADAVENQGGPISQHDLPMPLINLNFESQEELGPTVVITEPPAHQINTTSSSIHNFLAAPDIEVIHPFQS
jgi:hypothetical protein